MIYPLRNCFYAETPMQTTLKTTARMMGAVAALAVGLTAGSAVPVAAASDPMPIAQQNALVQKHCAVCHNDAHLNGGLSLEHFDAARPDPTVAAMMLSKVRDAGAMGAASIPLPDKTTQDALVSALTAEAIGASAWTVNRTQEPTGQAPILTASIVREVPRVPRASKRFVGDTGAPDIYRLMLTCRADSHEGEMQVAWAPGSPRKGSVISAALDGQPPFTYQVDGSETMFKGAVGNQGEGAIILSATKSLPEQTLTVNDLFQDGTVAFPFDGLSQEARHALSSCFSGSVASR
jgi:hypothetical protein